MEVASRTHTIESAIIAGLTASVPMGVFLLLASGLYRDMGFFTPAYQVAAFIDPLVLDESITEANAGNPFYWVHLAMVFGIALHAFVAAFFGVGFGLLARALRLQGLVSLCAGIAYGVVILLFMGTIGLPFLADAMLGGPAIAELPAAIGWEVMAVAHVIYGAGLGLWPRLRPQDIGLAPLKVTGGLSWVPRAR